MGVVWRGAADGRGGVDGVQCVGADEAARLLQRGHSALLEAAAAAEELLLLSAAVVEEPAGAAAVKESSAQS